MKGADNYETLILFKFIFYLMIVMILVVSIETLMKYSIWHMLVYSLSR